MKKNRDIKRGTALALACVLTGLALPGMARPYRGCLPPYRPPYGHRPPCYRPHNGHYNRWDMGAAFIGGAILGNALARPSSPVYIQTPPPPPPPVYVPVPVPPPPPPRGHYERRVEKVWVPAGWSVSTDAYGNRTRIWRQGYWEKRTSRVWVP